MLALIKLADSFLSIVDAVLILGALLDPKYFAGGGGEIWTLSGRLFFQDKPPLGLTHIIEIRKFSIYLIVKEVDFFQP